MRIEKLEEGQKALEIQMEELERSVKEISLREEELGRNIRLINLHLENETDKGINLLAENFIDLSNKLNMAVPVANKNLAYEVKVNYLIGEVNKLKDNVATLIK